MKAEFKDRQFQLWEYRVSHGSLLIRSPKNLKVFTNIDIICVGVEYIAAPHFINGMIIDEVTKQEIQQLESILGKHLKPESIIILSAQGHRFPIVAAQFKIEENEVDIFDSPFDA